LSSAHSARRILLSIAGVLLAGLAQAAPQAYTDRTAFDAALPGSPVTLDFDSASPDAIIPDGGNLDGILFSYLLDGAQLKVSTTASSYSTTSGSQFLGSDDADILQDGDELTLAFLPVNALGLYIISNDEMEDSDVTLTGGGTSVSLIKTAVQGAPLADGSKVWFLGIIDAQADFATVTLSTGANTAFLFNVDDIVTAIAVDGDDDGDGVTNSNDNCSAIANGPNDTATAGPSQNNMNTGVADIYGNVCDADFNDNGVVDSNDASVLFGQFGMNSTNPSFRPDVDMNGNGVIDSNDASILFGTFGGAPGPSGLVP
jgi:hypothetical protein